MKKFLIQVRVLLVVVLFLTDSALAGRKIISQKVNVAVQAPVVLGSQDFQTRCSAPGVVKCVSFDQASDISGGFGENSGIMPGTNNQPQLDTAVKASGNSSLKFTVTTSSANSGGSYFTNFSSDLKTQFDSGQTFYVQWRQRFTAAYIAQTGQYGNGGWKQVIVGSGDKVGCTKSNSLTIDSGGFCSSSCTALETVVQNTYHRGFPVMYNSCTGSSSTQNGKLPSTGPYYPFEESFNSYDFKIQNARPSPYCLYSQGSTNSYFPPKGNCFGYVPDQWMTFKMKIVIGTRTADYFKGSHVDLWVGREGQPLERIFDWNWDLAAGIPTQNLMYGKIWLLTYNSNNNGNNGATIPTGYTWYDDLIISTQDIADPK